MDCGERRNGLSVHCALISALLIYCCLIPKKDVRKESFMEGNQFLLPCYNSSCSCRITSLFYLTKPVFFPLSMGALSILSKLCP